jgi:hypothetical protein
MRSNSLKIFNFLLFIFAAEDSSRWYDNPHIHAAKNEVANRVKYLIWFSLSIAFSLMLSKLN